MEESKSPLASPLFRVKAVPKNMLEQERKMALAPEPLKDEPMEQSREKSHEEGINEGKWTDEEHERFLEGLKLYGKNWNMIRQHVGTRTCP